MSVESRRADRKILAIFIAVIGFLATLSGYLYYNYTTTVSTKDAEISSLTFVNNMLKNEIKNLTDRLNALQLENNRLESTIKDLTAQVSYLQNQNSYLNNKVTALENDVKRLEDVINLRIRIVLDRDKTVNIAANSYITLRYDTRYAAGYLIISFTATRDIYIWIANDYVGGYYYRYPVPTRGLTYASSGSFIVPILPGTTYIEIYNPSWFSGVTVTITIEYIY